MRRWLVGGALAAAVLVLALAVAYGYLRSASLYHGRDVRLAGLAGEVEVWRDSLGVPHIWAGSDEDLALATGYVHAQDRLWQMELFRRVAQGRLSEVLGERLLETDKFLRTIDPWGPTAEAERRLAPEERRILEAYAAGVNGWLATRRALPPEFVALRFQPEPWTVRHSLAVERVMAWDLTQYGIGLSLARALRRLGPERAGFLFPESPDWGATILDAPLPPEVPAPAAALIEAVSMARASNAWVVGGTRTRSGKPILANDMHLDLRAPGIWYLAALHADGLSVAGMTIPGVPFVVAGHNRAIAWGFTNASLDDADFFIERPDPDDPGRYLTPDGSAPFETASETIRVRGLEEPVVLTVRRTRHGPILTPVEGRADGELIAFRWTGHDPSRTLGAIAELNRAAGWDDFVRAIAGFDSPHQNVVYADTAGNFGYYMAGRVPVRGTGRPPPLLPVPGWTGEWDWTGELPIERHPHVLNPPQGYVVTANNRQAAGAAADLISAYWEEPFRAMRIREMIENDAVLDAEAVHRQQLDVRDALAARYRDRAVAAAERAGLADAAALLRAWDLRAADDSRGAALFYVWRDHLRDRVRHALYGPGGGWLPWHALTTVLERRTLPWVDVGGASAYDSLAAAAMAAADSIARGKTWGELHQVVIEHALGGVRALERSLRLNIGPAPFGGSPTTVNVAHGSGPPYPVRVTSGASQRHVVDMGDVDGAGGFIIPAGQSGVPFSSHYRDQFERWRIGGLWRVPLDRERAERRAVHRMMLRPETGK